MERHFSVRLSARVDSYVAAIKAAEASTVGFARSTERNMTKVGKQLQNTGRKMTRYVTLPLAAMGVGVVAAAVSWESAWTGVVKTTGVVGDAAVKLEGELRDLAKTLPQTHAEIAGVAEAAGQLGIKADDIAEFTKVMLGLGVATNITAQDAAINLARVARIMGTTADEYGKMGSSIVHLGNNAATSEQEIVELGTRIASAGKIAGLSEADIFAFGAAVTEVGVKAEAGGTALSVLFLNLRDATISGGQDLENIAKVAGVSAAEFKRAFEDDAAGAVGLWIEGVGRMEAAGGSSTQVFADMGLSQERLKRVVRSLGGAQGLLAQRLLESNTAWDENLALNEEAERRYGTLASKFGVLRNNAVDLGITLGEMLFPAIEALMTVAGGMIEAIAAMPSGMQAAVMGIGALVAATGPAVFLLGSLIRNLQTLRKAAALASLASMGPVLVGVAAAAVLVTGAIVAFKQNNNTAADIAKRAADNIEAEKVAVEELAEALAASGSPHELYKSSVLDLALSSKVMQDAMKAGGITVEDLTNGTINGAERLKTWAVNAGYTQQEAYHMASAFTELEARFEDANTLAAALTLGTEALTGGLDDNTMAVDENGVAYDADAEAIEAAEKALALYEARTEAATEAIEKQIEALEAEMEAYNNIIEAYSDAASGLFGLHDAEDALTESVAEYLEMVASGEGTMRDHLQALDGITESAIAVAEEQIGIAESTAEMNGSVLTATEKVDLMNDSLITQAAALDGPARKAILDHLVRLNGLPPLVATAVEVLIAEGKLTEAETLVEEFSKPRTLAITVDLDDADAKRARAALQAPMSTSLYIRPVYLTGGTVGLNPREVDGGGFARRGDLVAERRPEFVDGDLVTGPKLMTTSAQITSGASTDRLLRQFLAAAPRSGTVDNGSQTTSAPNVEVAVTLDGRELRHEIDVTIKENDRQKVGAL